MLNGSASAANTRLSKQVRSERQRLLYHKRARMDKEDTTFLHVATTNASGSFTITTGLPDGTYDWWFKGAKWLANSGTLTISGGMFSPELDTQRAGDANDSNIVNAQDFTILKVTFGKGVGDPSYDSRADFNCDSMVNSFDFTLLRPNFGMGGAAFSCLSGR